MMWKSAGRGSHQCLRLSWIQGRIVWATLGSTSYPASSTLRFLRRRCERGGGRERGERERDRTTSPRTFNDPLDLCLLSVDLLHELFDLCWTHVCANLLLCLSLIPSFLPSFLPSLLPSFFSLLLLMNFEFICLHSSNLARLSPPSSRQSARRLSPSLLSLHPSPHSVVYRDNSSVGSLVRKEPCGEIDWVD